MVKMMIVGRRRGGMTVAQHHRYMKHEHGQSVVNFIAEKPEMAPRRYVQNHVFDGSFRVPGATPVSSVRSRSDVEIREASLPERELPERQRVVRHAELLQPPAPPKNRLGEEAKLVSRDHELRQLEQFRDFHRQLPQVVVLEK